MNKIRILIFVLFLSLINAAVYPSNSPDNTLLKYYSALLTLNLNHSMEASGIIYHLSKEPAFDKKFLEDEITKLQQNVEYANNDIANIIFNTIDSKKIEIDKSLKNIDKHLAQVLVDFKEIKNRLTKSENISPYLSDIYHQIEIAENEDHQEIKKILYLKSDEEPLLVIPEKM